MDVGTNWGGEYSRFSFDETKQYLMVAKEMLVPGTATGVPLLDSEMNENAEISAMALRRVIARFFGDGTAGDYFKIVQSPTNTTNNFKITGGGGAVASAAWISVTGWIPILLTHLEYTAQAGASSLTTPGGDRTDEVYIDVYLDEVGPVVDSNIVDPSIGYETSRRVKLVSSIKVIEGGATPGAYTDANGVPHYTYKLATLNRLAGNATILTAMITDERRIVAGKRQVEYVHVESPASASWVVAHNLNVTYPRVVVYDGSGVEIEPGGVTVNSADQVTLDFDGTTVAGTAVISGFTAS